MPAPDSSLVPDPSLLPDPPPQRLSAVRLVAALLLIVVAGGVGALALRHSSSSAADERVLGKNGTWFAPYVDVTLTPTSAFQNRAANPSRDVVLGFIVADKQRRCDPSWGTYQSLDGAARSQDLDRRVAQVRGEGGDAVISFGGQANDELAVACDDEKALTAGYRAVLDRYAADTVDFDIEGPAIADTAANERRAKAVKTLQDETRAKGGHLAVWLTLPVLPDGLRADSLALIRGMLAAKVDLAGVNVMAMNFGEDSHLDMVKAIGSSAQATHDQLSALYAQAGLPISSRQLWSKVGITVMIGQNDLDQERLTVPDARKVVDFVREHRAGRLSMWSLNRDDECGVTFPVVGTHSNLCSGVAQKKLQFSKIFNQFKGGARQDAERVTSPDAEPQATTATKDDPAKSPYPVWNPREPYPEGTKIVWHQAVYQSRWYTQGDTPDAPHDVANSPWTLVGPVLRGDTPPAIPKSKPGTHPKWSRHGTYERGDKVLHLGLPYRARWYTAGDVPGHPTQDGSPSPWEPLFKVPGRPKGSDSG